MQTWIGLLDCNNFFVSCERLFRPDLWHRPTLVLSSNDGCVIARSQEVKDIGVPMGIPSFQIKDIIKDKGIQVFSSNFTLYRDISARVVAVLREQVQELEQYSIDESFFIFNGSQAEAETFAAQVKQVVETAVGVPVSIGLAASKTQAKVANHIAKRTTGVAVMSGAMWTEVARTLPLGDVWGVGARLRRQYQESGIETAAQLIECDQSRIAARFGIVGVRLRQELLGNAVYSLSGTRPLQKNLMHSRSFGVPTTDLTTVLDAVAYHTRAAVAELRAMNAQTRSLRVSIWPSRHGDYVLRGGSKEVVLPLPTNDTLELLRYAQQATKLLFEPGVPYQKAGIVLSGIQSTALPQASLFTDQAQDQKRSTLWKTIDSLNQKYGRERVVMGQQQRSPLWQVKQERLSPAVTTKWSDIPVVQAS